ARAARLRGPLRLDDNPVSHLRLHLDLLAGPDLCARILTRQACECCWAGQPSPRPPVPHTFLCSAQRRAQGLVAALEPLDGADEEIPDEPRESGRAAADARFRALGLDVPGHPDPGVALAGDLHRPAD